MSFQPILNETQLEDIRTAKDEQIDPNALNAIWVDVRLFFTQINSKVLIADHNVVLRMNNMFYLVQIFMPYLDSLALVLVFDDLAYCYLIGSGLLPQPFASVPYCSITLVSAKNYLIFIILCTVYKSLFWHMWFIIIYYIYYLYKHELVLLSWVGSWYVLLKPIFFLSKIIFLMGLVQFP